MITQHKGKSPVVCADWLGVDEVKDYSIDVSNQLVDRDGNIVDQVSDVTWFFDPDDGKLQKVNQDVQGTLIIITLATPVDGTEYRVKALVTTSLTRKFADGVLLIRGQQK